MKRLVIVAVVLLIALLAVTAAMAAYPPTSTGIAITTTTWSAAAPTMAASNKSAPWSTGLTTVVKKSDGMGAVATKAAPLQILRAEQSALTITGTVAYQGFTEPTKKMAADTDVGTEISRTAAPDTPTTAMATTGTFVGMMTKAIAAPAPTKLAMPMPVVGFTFTVVKTAVGTTS